MRKSLLFSFIAMLFAFAVYGGHASTREYSEEDWQLEWKMLDISQTLHMGALKPWLFNAAVVYPFYPKGATREQVEEFNEKMREYISSAEDELREKLGDPGDYSRDRLDEVAETVATLLPKVNEAVCKIVRETFSAEVVAQIEMQIFQKFGGVFGGALDVENLAPLNLTEEQREKVVKITVKVNRERLKLYYSLEIDLGELGWAPEPEEEKEIFDKMVSLTRNGQREIEAILTDEQKQRAEELMADIPEEIRFLSDYLKEHP